MIKTFLRSLPQFSLYVLSGGTAAIMDFGLYELLIRINMWYIAASMMSSALGFATTFLMNKYIAFRKKTNFVRHLARFSVVEVMNIAVTTLILFGLVDGFGVEEQIAKILAMGIVVSWNFFIYKFFVYV